MWVDGVDDGRHHCSARHGYTPGIRDGSQKHRSQDNDGAPRGDTAVRVDPLLPSLPRLLTGLRDLDRCLDYSRRLHKVKGAVTACGLPNSRRSGASHERC
jgi:hypothetical protein